MTVSDCQIVDEDFRTILKATLDYFSKNNISYFHRATHKGYLRHLLVRKATKTGEIIVDLVTTTQTEGFDEEELLAGFRYALLTRHYDGRFKGVLHTKMTAWQMWSKTRAQRCSTEIHISTRSS